MKAVEVPEIGESITEGIIAAWLKEDGEYVEDQEELFELETVEATLAVPSPASGILKIRVEEGAEVQVGQVVAEIEPGEAQKKSGPVAEVDFEIKLEDKKPSSAPHAEEKMKEAHAGAKPVQSEAAKPAITKQAATLSPAVTRLVQQYRLDPTTIRGTGKDGRITKKDVLVQIENMKKTKEPVREIVLDIDKKEEKPPERPQPRLKDREDQTEAAAAAIQVNRASQGEKRVKMTSIRKRMAENLLHAKQNAAHVTTFNEIDMSRVIHLRKTYAESFADKYGIRLGFMSFFVKACCAALAAYPVLNAEVNGNDIVYHNYYNIQVALSTESGLIVPVIRNADFLSFAQIEGMIRGFITRAKEKKLTVPDLTGGSFSITNGGVFGSLLSTPIPNPPQVAILGMHAINDRPVAVNGEVAVRPMMNVALTYDHRIVEDREAVRFLVRVRECIEDPPRLLIDI